MFKVGDAVVHPARGAGVVVGFEEYHRSGSVKRYYNIELLVDSSTQMMVPVKAAESIGLRPPISETQLGEIWRVLGNPPKTLPDNYKPRQKLVEEQLNTGDVLEIAKAIRDMTWREHEESDLTKRGKKIYQRGLSLLAAEIAAAQGVSLEDAERQVRSRLDKVLPSEVVIE